MSNRHGGGITRALGAGIKVELDGDWVRLTNVMNRMPTEVVAATMAAQEKAAEKYKRKIKRNIRTNAFGYANSPYYSIYKAEHHGSPQPLMFTNKLVNSIITKRNNKGTTVQVTIDENARYQAGDHGRSKAPRLSVKQIANVLEHGSDAKSIPARPVWKRTFREMGGRKFFHAFIARSLSQRLRVTLR